MKIPKLIEKVKLQEKKIAFLELREKQIQEDLEKWAKWTEGNLKSVKEKLDKINKKD
mgnify:CR=1 FL=1